MSKPKTDATIDGLLVIAPCGQKKIWDKDATAGPTAARHVYTGSPFTVNRAFAEYFGQTWVILSAKHGFIEPEFEIQEPYNVTFKRKATGPISVAQIREQVRAQRLDQFDKVIGLGGKEYRQAIEAAFDGTSVALHFPFSGLPIGKAMQATKRAIAARNPGIEQPSRKGLIQRRESVLQAIKECDQLGRIQFLERHGFRAAKSYFLVHEGRHYDSKAIVGVAYGFEHPRHGSLKASEFSGGAATVRNWLKHLGFDVKKITKQTHQRPRTPKKKTRVTSGPDFAAGNVAEICRTVHHWLNALPVFSFPYIKTEIPRNGIYVLFEDGEQAHGTERIVRVGTHTGDNQLRSRLKQHFVNENKDRSIFRKNIGRCMLNRDNDSFLPAWELDLTSRKAKDRYASQIDFERQTEIEQAVSKYMQSHLRFAVFEVLEKDRRLELESRIASTVSLCTDCGPSAGWLGLHSPKKKIRENGLWQVNELNKKAFSADELQAFRDCLQPAT